MELIKYITLHFRVIKTAAVYILITIALAVVHSLPSTVSGRVGPAVSFAQTEILSR
jgi:hypothetical protein